MGLRRGLRWISLPAAALPPKASGPTFRWFGPMMSARRKPLPTARITPLRAFASRASRRFTETRFLLRASLGRVSPARTCPLLGSWKVSGVHEAGSCGSGYASWTRCQLARGSLSLRTLLASSLLQTDPTILRFTARSATVDTASGQSSLTPSTGFHSQDRAFLWLASRPTRRPMAMKHPDLAGATTPPCNALLLLRTSLCGGASQSLMFGRKLSKKSSISVLKRTALAGHRTTSASSPQGI